jgi:hypothetical protein
LTQVIMTKDIPWEPLRRILKESNCLDFMAMAVYRNGDGSMIHAYKHMDTRRYLFVDGSDNFYRYDTGNDDYRAVTKEEALQPFKSCGVELSLISPAPEDAAMPGAKAGGNFAIRAVVEIKPLSALPPPRLSGPAELKEQ